MKGICGMDVVDGVKKTRAPQKGPPQPNTTTKHHQHKPTYLLGTIPGEVLVPDIGLHRVHPRVDGRLHKLPQLRQAGADLPDGVAHRLGRGGEGCWCGCVLVFEVGVGLRLVWVFGWGGGLGEKGEKGEQQDRGNGAPPLTCSSIFLPSHTHTHTHTHTHRKRNTQTTHARTERERERERQTQRDKHTLSA
jgi:hypothetical protein